MDAVGLEEEVVLLELGVVAGFVDSVGFAAEFSHDGEARDIAGTVGDVDHVLEGDAPVFGGHLGVDVDGVVFVGAFVDLEEGAGLRGVVDHGADLADDVFAFDLEVVLVEVARLERVFDEFATPDAVDVGGDGGPAYHLGEAGGDDVVLELDIVAFVVRAGASELAQVFEESGQAFVELDLFAQFAKHLVVETGHFAGSGVGEDVVEVDAFAGDSVAALFVAFGHGIDLSPEERLVDLEFFEDRLLHVAGDKGFVEIPYDGDFVLSRVGVGHGWKGVNCEG